MLLRHHWLIYFVAALGLSLTPEPNSLLVITHGALHDRRRTLATVAGGAIGFLVLTPRRWPASARCCRPRPAHWAR